MTRLFGLSGLWLLLILSGIAFAVIAIAAPLDALRGWMTAFVFAVMISTGALLLLLTHRITGGEWGEALAPVLLPTARAILPLALAAAPALLFSEAIYRWANAPEMPATVTQHYMNAPLFALRAIIALSLWSLFAWIPPLRATLLRAGLGLIAMAVITNLIPVDWVISAKPGYYSSGFGFGFAVESIFAALALCAILGPQGEDRRECRDLAGLLVSALLGTVYFLYMQFVIIWYGNLPEKADWYVIRQAAPWPAIMMTAFALAAVLPFLALLNKTVRESEAALRLIGAGVLLGIALHAIWLLVPSFGIGAFLPAVISMLFLGTLFALWLTRSGLRLIARLEREEAPPLNG